jgi:hypothetical protein
MNPAIESSTGAPSRRRLVAGMAAVVAFGAAALAGCRSAPLMPRAVHISQDELMRSVGERFPVDRRMLEIINITIANPRVELRPAENRLGSEFEVTALDTFFSRQSLRGTLKLNYALRYEPGDGTVRLAQVRIEQFLFDGVPEVLRRRLDRVGAVLGEQMLENMVVHRVNPQRLEQARGLGLVPGQPRVVAGGIDIPLEKAPAR